MSDRLDFTTINKPNEEVYKKICERFGCNNSAIDEVDLLVGKFGVITIHVCKGCKSFFEEN